MVFLDHLEQTICHLEVSRRGSSASNGNLTLSSPEYPKSNGLAEKGVQVVKKMIKKCLDSQENLNLALIAFRSVPNESGLSPAQLLFGRQIRSKIPVPENQLNGRFDERNKENMIK